MPAYAVRAKRLHFFGTAGQAPIYFGVLVPTDPPCGAVD
jgi:hypothetical protein